MLREEISLYESPAVIKHIELLQDIISRMANNSASCKTWALTIITALIALSTVMQRIPIIICIIPTIMFFLLDAYYLGLERHFICLQKEFVNKLKNNTIEVEDFYLIKAKNSIKSNLKFIYNGMRSFSTSFIYASIIIVIIILDLVGL
jgi:hypothetical protein